MAKRAGKFRADLLVRGQIAQTIPVSVSNMGKSQLQLFQGTIDVGEKEDTWHRNKRVDGR